MPWAALVLTLLAVSILLSACSNNGLGLAREACTHVNKSITFYARSQHATSSARARSDQTRATEELEAALPIAAQANSADPQWNPLMTTLERAGSTSEGHLVAALEAQCSLAAESNEHAPVIPSQPAPSQGTHPASSPSTLPGQ